jgi:hypothetical protein
MAFDIPDSCALPTAERPFRLKEFDALLDHSVGATRTSATQLTLSLRGDDRLEPITRDLTAREASCCSFFDFSIQSVDGDVVLGIGVPAQHAGILDSLQSRTVSAP